MHVNLGSKSALQPRIRENSGIRWQTFILSSAAQHEDRLASAPEGIKAAAARAAITRLLGLKLLKEVRVKRDQPAWRSYEDEKPIGLKITKVGSAAIRVESDGKAEEAAAQAGKEKRKTARRGLEEHKADATQRGAVKGP